MRPCPSLTASALEIVAHTNYSPLGFAPLRNVWCPDKSSRSGNDMPRPCSLMGPGVLWDVDDEAARPRPERYIDRRKPCFGPRRAGDADHLRRGWMFIVVLAIGVRAAAELLLVKWPCSGLGDAAEAWVLCTLIAPLLAAYCRLSTVTAGLRTPSAVCDGRHQWPSMAS